MSKLVILLGFCLAITYLLDFGACESSPLSAAAAKVASPSHFRAFRGRDVDDDDERYFQKRQMDDYGHMRFGKRQNQDFDDYGHMRFGK